jgi:tetratricopeptide (TPR) repeat protein
MSSESPFDELCKQADANVRQREYAQAISLYQEAIELNGDNAAAHDGLATAYFLTKNYVSAAEHFQRVTKLDPQSGKAHINLGAVYNCLGEYQKAVDSLRRGVQRDKKSAEGYYNLGIAHKKLDQASMAISAYREAIRLNPDMAEAHQNIANVLRDMKNLKQAIKHYKTALEIRPDFERAKRGLEAAQAATAESKANANPFGRLVEAAPKASADAQGMARSLTEEERIFDREAVLRLSTTIVDATEKLAEQLKDDFEPALLILNRAVSQGDEGIHLVSDAHTDVQNVTRDSAAIRDVLKTAVQELKSHEKSFKAS